jgi:hypothetical protein
VTLVRICVDDESQVQIHEYEAGPSGVPRVGDHIDYGAHERLVTKVIWGFLDPTNGVEAGWVTVLIEPVAADRTG